MSHLSNISTSVVSVESAIETQTKLVVAGCSVMIGVAQILYYNNTQTNTIFNTNNRSANVAQMRYHDNTLMTTHKPILHPATTTEELVLLKQG